jgi:hypothetical protein
VSGEYGVGNQFIRVDEETRTVASIIIVLESPTKAKGPDVLYLPHGPML